MSGRRSLRELGRSAAALAFGFAIGGCAAIIPNAPLDRSALNDESGPISKSGYRLAALPQKETASDLLVPLFISVGSERSAALGYRILNGRPDFDLPRLHRRVLAGESQVRESQDWGQFRPSITQMSQKQ